MPRDLSLIDTASYAAALAASELVEDGMRVGFGKGNAVAMTVRCLGNLVRGKKLRMRAVASSSDVADLARNLGIEVLTLDQAGWLDMAICGADEFDGDLNLITGKNGQLLNDKIIATASDEVIVVADETKGVSTLGACPLPVEVLHFGLISTINLIQEVLGSLDMPDRESILRMENGRPFVTDSGNLILDLHLGKIRNPRSLAIALNQVPGVVENGLLIDICDRVVVGCRDGRSLVRDFNTGLVSDNHLDRSEAGNLFDERYA